MPSEQGKPQRKRGTRNAEKKADSPQPKRLSDASIRRKCKRTFGAAGAPFAREKTTWIGDLLYNFGFYGEYHLIQIGRVLRDGGIFLGQILMWLFGGFFSKFFGFFAGLGRDLVAPITNHREAKREAAGRRRQRGEKPPSAAKSFFAFLANVVRFAMPVAATAVLVYVVYSTFSMNYALAVEVDGEVIGYVSDETVLEEAQSILKSKIELAPNQTLAEWDFAPVLSIATPETVSNKNEIANEILRTSDDVDYANGVTVEGVLVGVTRDGDSLRALLQSMLDQYYDPENPEAAISFVSNVEVSEDGNLFFTESIMDYSELELLLTGTQKEAVYHTATGDESLSDIALTGQVTVDLLKQRNPDFADARDTFVPEAGTSLLISRAVPYLQVQMAYTYSDVAPIEHDTEEVTNESMPVGRRIVQTQGVDGEQKVYYDVVYIDGEEVQTVQREDLTEVITPAVTEVVEVGTGVALGGGGFSSGDYAWPLPDWKGMSRGFMGAAHRGLDLRAPYGTPVYAANGGVVLVAGWHWSYGNYVEIEHPDGLVTLYAHNSALYVVQGQSVGRMDPIAAVGSTGVSTGNHLHFEVKVNGVQVDPDGFVPRPELPV